VQTLYATKNIIGMGGEHPLEQVAINQMFLHWPLSQLTEVVCQQSSMVWVQLQGEACGICIILQL
jgi:hypothetical protein